MLSPPPGRQRLRASPRCTSGSHPQTRNPLDPKSLFTCPQFCSINQFLATLPYKDSVYPAATKPPDTTSRFLEVSVTFSACADSPMQSTTALGPSWGGQTWLPHEGLFEKEKHTRLEIPWIYCCMWEEFLNATGTAFLLPSQKPQEPLPGVQRLFKSIVSATFGSDPLQAMQVTMSMPCRTFVRESTRAVAGTSPWDVASLAATLQLSPNLAMLGGGVLSKIF